MRKGEEEQGMREHNEKIVKTRRRGGRGGTAADTQRVTDLKCKKRRPKGPKNVITRFPGLYSIISSSKQPESTKQKLKIGLTLRGKNKKATYLLYGFPIRGLDHSDNITLGDIHATFHYLSDDLFSLMQVSSYSRSGIRSNVTFVTQPDR